MRAEGKTSGPITISRVENGFIVRICDIRICDNDKNYVDAPVYVFQQLNDNDLTPTEVTVAHFLTKHFDKRGGDR